MPRRFTPVVVAVLLLTFLGGSLAVPDVVAAAGTATLNITLRGCPDGIDPTAVSNARSVCDVPLDAPDNAIISYGGDGQGGEEVRYLDRKYDGTYVARIPANRTVNLIGFEPTVRDSYAMTGVSDRDNDGSFDVQVRSGRTARVRVYYYNTNAAPPRTRGGSATVHMTFRACPDDVDPNYVDAFSMCTIPLDAPDASMAIWDYESGVSIAALPRQNDGTYVLETPNGILSVGLINLAPVVRNSYLIFGTDYQGARDAWGLNLRRGEVRDIWVFYYYS